MALHDDGLPVLAGAAPARMQPHRRAGPVRALTHRRRRVLVGLARLALAGVQDLQWGSIKVTPEYCGTLRCLTIHYSIFVKGKGSEKASYLEYSRNVFGFCPDHVALRHRSDVEYFAKMVRNIAVVLMLQIIRPSIHPRNSNNYELV